MKADEMMKPFNIADVCIIAKAGWTVFRGESAIAPNELSLGDEHATHVEMTTEQKMRALMAEKLSSLPSNTIYSVSYFKWGSIKAQIQELKVRGWINVPHNWGLYHMRVIVAKSIPISPLILEDQELALDGIRWLNDITPFTGGIA